MAVATVPAACLASSAEEDTSDDCFTLGHESRNNVVRNLKARYAGGKVRRDGGNGLSDYGNGNKWYDSLAENCGSDGWTPKSKNSEFHRCVARNNDGPGFGCYARLDGSPKSDSDGSQVDGNKFIDILSYNNRREGISFNIADNSGSGATVRGNMVKGVFYNNGMYGVAFRNRLASGIIENNQLDILVFNNDTRREDGKRSGASAGLNVDGKVRRLTGNVVAYGNVNSDIGLTTARDSSLKAYSPSDQKSVAVKAGDSSNRVEVIPFSCPGPKQISAVTKYCALKK